MATSSTISLPAAPFSTNSQEAPIDSSQMASQLLQENHERHHMFFNGEGFHNHISHALLTLWALGAPANDVKQAYDLNKVFQRPQMAADQAVGRNLQDEEEFMKHMSDDNNYKTFLDFFARDITDSSWQAVVQKYLFAGDARADAMLVRLFDSFLHPLIHLGFGVELAQPAIIAEALAQTACHQGWIAELLLPAETVSTSVLEPKGQVELLDEIQQDQAIVQAPRWSDADKIRDGIIGRAGERMIQYLAQVKVDSRDLASRVAEMMNAATYLAAAAQRPGKAVKFDFYLLHCLTSSSFFSIFQKQTWLSEGNKARLLEWKMRMDLVMYASRKSPTLDIDAIRSYKAKRVSGWNEIKTRVCSIPDDGHASKLIRAIAHGQEVCRPYQTATAFHLKEDDWHKVALMAIDSVEIEGQDEKPQIQFDGPGQAWVRSAGFDEAWKDIPDVA